jgi:multiple sugar transport system substrate-binding protein
MVKKRILWLMGLAVLTIVLALSGCSSSSNTATQTSASKNPTENSDKKIELKMEWWGSQARNDLTIKALKLFEAKHPNITIKPQFSTYDTYLDKLSVEVAGGNAADLIQMENTWMNDFGKRNILLDLTPYIKDNTINTDKIEKAGILAGTLNDKVLATPMGFVSQGVIYDSTVFKELGIEEPKESWTWKDFSDLSTKIAKAKGKGFYGTLDITSVSPTVSNVELYVRQYGDRLFGENKMGATSEELTNWFKLWDDLRKTGGATPPEVTSNAKSNIETRPITQGITAMDFDTQNKLPVYQKAMKDQTHKLKIVPIPHLENEKKNGNYLRSSVMLSGNAKTKYPKEVAMVINFLLNDKEAGKILSVDRGVPANNEIADLIKPTLTEPEQIGFDFIKTIAAKGSDTDPLWPPGYPEFEKKLKTTAESISYEKNTIEKAVHQFEMDADRILSGSN